MVFNSLFNGSRKESLPLYLVGLFIALNFTAELTKFKNLTVILMIATAIYFLFKNYHLALAPLKNNLFVSVIFFVLTIFYSLFISIDSQISFDSMNKPILNSILLFSFVLPIVLHKNSAVQIAKMILLSIAAGLVITCTRDLLMYIDEYRQGIIPFTEMTHRDLSDSYVLCFPVILSLWYIYKKNTLTHWACLIIATMITITFMLGTFTRGLWLSVVVMSAIVITFNKEKMLAFMGMTALICGAVTLVSYDHTQEHLLTKKMEQTSSSNRYGGGTQGTALELILQNPIKGYGFGNSLFHRIYNDQVKNHPEWIYKQSLGPHNVFLAIWFAAGIVGLLALITLTLSTINYAYRAFVASRSNIITAQAVLLLMVSFIGWVIVRGTFENVYLNVLGIHFGLLMALGFRIKVENT
ncbi:O-antigen ligase RfaL [Kosakonia sp. SOY2]|uniref:O-antigen ligase RfaL n=1 Tax=Kosakonia sp. SOY2 TaxID=3014557 RepID=UPI0022AC6A6B|nr:O-antigen ligase RfaL [Kosakonia sp. SOY2]MCZ3384037.1 O-antigen ligase RfaL [Kosakonia sp. SOY2]